MNTTPQSPRGRLIYAASETDADLLYASRFQAPDPFLWFTTPAETGIVVSALEFGRAAKTCLPECRVLTDRHARDCWGVPAAKTGAADLIAGLARNTGIRTWEVPASFPLGLAREVARKRIRLEPVEPFFPERAIKSTQEIDWIREGVELAERGLSRALDILRHSSIGRDDVLSWNDQPLTAEILRGAVDAEIARTGGTASHTIVAPSRQGADPHEAGHGVIKAHTPIVIDIFPRVDRTGYHGDLTRTVVKGDPPEKVTMAYKAVHEAQRKAIAAIGPDVNSADVHRLVADTLLEHGFQTDAGADPPFGFFHGTGHGLGLQIHEMPRIGRRSPGPLESGHVVTVEPGLYYPEWGGVRLEDVVAVTDNGCENLTSAPFELVIR